MIHARCIHVTDVTVHFPLMEVMHDEVFPCMNSADSVQRTVLMSHSLEEHHENARLNELLYAKAVSISFKHFFDLGQ